MKSSMSVGKKLKILLLERSPEDAGQVIHRLRKDGVTGKIKTVDSEKGFLDGINEFQPDVILSGYNLPVFNNESALSLAREKNPELPFIFLTGEIGGERVVEMLHKGATDFVFKGNLSQLVPAIRRAIKKKNHLLDRHSLAAALEDNEERYRSLIENLPVGIFRTTVSQPGRFLQTNLALARMYGADSVEDLMRIPPANLYADPSERDMLLAEIMERGFIKGRVVRYKTKNGGAVWGSMTATYHRNSGDTIDWIEGIIEDITERRQSEEERERILQKQSEINLLQQSLLAPASLEKKLKSITDGIVRIFDADFCRIWLIQPGDLCEQGCIHAQVNERPHVCRHRDLCLHLMSSSGRYTHIDGIVHRRVPFDCYKIGRVASGNEHKFITNDVQNDPRIHNREWASELGLVSFAGYQLRVPGGKIMGVLAIFARHTIEPVGDAMLDGLSSTVALVVRQTSGEEALRLSEEKFRGLFESSRDAIMTLEPPAWRFTSGNQATLAMFRAKSMEDFISRTPGDVSPDSQPDGRASAEKAGEMIGNAMREGSHFFEWTHKRIDGEEFPATVLLTRVDQAGKQFLQATVRDITEHKQAEINLRRTNEEMDLLLKSISSIIIGVSTKDRITHWNPSAEKLFGIKAHDIVGKRFIECGIAWDWKSIYEAISTSIIEDITVRTDDVWYRRRDGSEGILGLTMNPLKREGEKLTGFIILGTDLTQRRHLEHRLLQARKLESIGQLAAGVAHEINSPLQYVGDNLKFIRKSTSVLLDAIMGRAGVGENGKPGDFAYLKEELPNAIEQSIDGIMRVSKIVQSMKAFAHPGTGSKSPANINSSIENTVTVSRNEWKYDCDLELSLDPDLPLVPCFEMELNQVVLNLIVNAVDAIKDAMKKGFINRGAIKIETRRTGNDAVISVTDNGTGIPEEISQRVFDPFFTTKEVGKGTGQGLAIAHSIIVEKHGGIIYFESEPGKGTKFVMHLPIENINTG